MGELFYGYWDCKYCGTKHNRGDVRDCPNCGKPRGEDVKFYMDGMDEKVENPDKANKNPDWLCSFCGSLNSDSTGICPSCGHAREESDPDYFERSNNQPTNHSTTQPTPYTETYQSDKTEIRSSDNRNYYSETKRREKRRKRWAIAAISAAAAVFCAILAFIFIPKTKAIAIKSMPWQRTVTVEAYKTVDESSWTLPDGAHDVTEKREIKSYDHRISHYEIKTREKSRQVFDGYDVSYSYRDLGNGMFEQVEHKSPRYRTEYYTETYQEPVYIDVPVYATKYYYSIEKWVFDHYEISSGDDGRAYSPEVVYRDGVTRPGGESDEYYIVDENGNKYQIDYDLWTELQIGQNVKIVTQFGKIKGIKQ